MPGDYGLKADEKVVEQCRVLLPKLAQRVGEEKYWAVLRELWLHGVTKYDDFTGEVVADLTDLQLIALTYALAAFIKGGAEWDESITVFGRYTWAEVQQ